MSLTELPGWELLRHGGLLLDPPRLTQIAAHVPPPPRPHLERELRRQAALALEGPGDKAGFVAFVLEKVCGFSGETGTWLRGTSIPAEWGRLGLGSETIKPRQLWLGKNGGALPVFLDDEPRLGIGRGRRATSQVLQWLRGGREKLALLTNGRQWRLVFAGLDFDAWCEWDLDLWFEEGGLSPQVTALRTLLSPALWSPPAADEPLLLLKAIQDSRKGQSELSAVLGERVREAVELLVQCHGSSLAERCEGVDPADIYRAAVRVVMRMVVVFFAESRDLLPRANAVYHSAYGLTGLLEELEKTAARGGNRLARSWSAWPRVLALFRLVHAGSHHPELPVPAYGGELFGSHDSESQDGLTKALSVFETACYDHDAVSDRDVHRMLGFITRTRVKVRQGRSATWVSAPVDFSDLSSEYIGILYEGLLDFELKTAPVGDPVIFLAVGNQPALPLSRLEAMDDRALAELLENLKDTGSGEEAGEGGAGAGDSPADAATSPAGAGGEAEAAEDEAEPAGEDAAAEPGDDRHVTRTRAELWARRAVEAGKLVPRPRGTRANSQRDYEEKVARKARQLVTRVVLPSEWYLVRWGGTRKGSGTFYTRPGLAVPTAQRTLRPLAFDPPPRPNGEPDCHAPAPAWTPRKPEDILRLKVCDPACGSGTFPVAALRFLTDALHQSLYHHQRISPDGDRSLVKLLGEGERQEVLAAEPLGHELLPCRPDDPIFEPRLKAVLRRHVVERCIYGVDLDPLAVELCRLSLWIETMDRSLPFSFLDHKIKCGNSLVGAWFDQFQHYPVMAWKNREGGDKSHKNGVHFEKEARTKAIKEFVKDVLTPDLAAAIPQQLRLGQAQTDPRQAHEQALKVLARLHDLPVHDSAERSRVYRDEFLGSEAYRSLRAAMDLWCACWFWPADALPDAPLPSTFSNSPEATRALAASIAADERFIHWELEFPDVFNPDSAGFDAMLGNPPWNIAKPNSKEFFSEIDPLYRSYGKLEALRRQTAYFQTPEIERKWLEYAAHFRAYSNYIKYAARPFGDPKLADKSQDRFSIGRGHQSDLLHDRWRQWRARTATFAQDGHSYRYQGSADINLYKLMLEQAYALLRNGGRLGLIVPSGVYSDFGTKDLREQFIERSRWEWLFGLENRDGIFDIDSRETFNPIIVQKASTTEAIQTAFMRRRLEDWEEAEAHATTYDRARIEQFSPRSKVLLEVQSARDLAILSKVYTNSVLLGDDGPSGWAIEYAREFDMTNDSALFPANAKWQDRGFTPNEYGIWIGPDGDAALPLYQGVMIGQYDFCAAAYVSGAGNRSVWRDLSWEEKNLWPQFLMAKADYEGTEGAVRGAKVVFRDIARSTDERSFISAVVPDMPCGNKLPILGNAWPLVGVVNSLAFDWSTRQRLAGTTLNLFIVEELPVPAREQGHLFRREVLRAIAGLAMPHSLFAPYWLPLMGDSSVPWKRLWAVTEHERLRLRCILDAVLAFLYGLDRDDFGWVLRECDHPASSMRSDAFTATLDQKGFWRVDQGRDPELRLTNLALVAFHELQGLGLDAFLALNNGEGWMLPETVCLADYGLGRNDRAKVSQPVASRLGPRHLDWQLEQPAEESWRECHAHARNLLGSEGFAQLLSDLDGADGNGAPPGPSGHGQEMEAEALGQLPLLGGVTTTQGRLF